MAGPTPCHDIFSFYDHLLAIFLVITFMELLLRWNWLNGMRRYIKDSFRRLLSRYFTTASHTRLRLEAKIWWDWHGRWFRAILAFDITGSDYSHYSHSSLIRRHRCESQIPRLCRNTRLVLDGFKADHLCILQLLHLGLETLSKEARREELVEKPIHARCSLLARHTNFSHNMLHIWTIPALIYLHFGQWNVNVCSQHNNVLPIIFK